MYIWKISGLRLMSDPYSGQEKHLESPIFIFLKTHPLRITEERKKQREDAINFKLRVVKEAVYDPVSLLFNLSDTIEYNPSRLNFLSEKQEYCPVS